MLQPGDTLSHYTIESLLGAGGMGHVYLAFDERLHRRVALKVISRVPEQEDAHELSARLLREARAAASLAHPNIVSVFDVGEVGGRVYLAMEHIVGRTLRERVHEGEIAWTRKLRWCVDMARALAAAHRSGLVHRDIKPDNVMVREDGLLKILDFGIARRAQVSVDPTGRTEAASVPTLTNKGVVIGTPMYMAPEQIRGGATTIHSDQFAFGVTAFELLAGTRPWSDQRDLLAVVAALLTEAPASLRARSPEVPEEVEAILVRCIARDPVDRFPTMDDVADALEPFALGGSMRPPEASASASAKARAAAPSTHKALVASTGPEAPHPAPVAKGRRRVRVLGGALAVAVVLLVAQWAGRPARSLLHVAAPIVSPSASASTRVVVKPPPTSKVAEATAAYAEGVQLFRDGAVSRVRASLERAAHDDPAFASPSLLRAVVALDGDPTEGREGYQRAHLHRASLDEQERALLDGIEPLFRANVDLAVAEARLRRAAEAPAADALVRYVLGTVLMARSDFEQASEMFDHASLLDPSFAPALRGRGDAARMRGDVAAARGAYDRCLSVSPSAATCIRQRLALARDLGECAQMEDDARAWAAAEPESHEASYELAAALLARGVPLPSVEEALRRQWTGMPESERAWSEPEDRAGLALLAGDFAAAEKHTLAWAKAVDARRDLLSHARPSLQLVSIASETGDAAQAARVADEHVKRMGGFTRELVMEDPSVAFHVPLFRSARIDTARLAELRASWLADEERGESARQKQRRAPFRWALAYAEPASGTDEAKEALAALPAFLPMPPDARRTPVFEEAVGKIYALTGDAAQAVPILTRATKACVALSHPVEHTRAFYFLGMAREVAGDLEGARAAYEVVVSRWGDAKPRSVTAEKARARLREMVR